MITDKVTWQAAAQKVITNLPADIEAVYYLPSKDLTQATCVWKAESVETLKDYLENNIGVCSTNTYYIVDEPSAVGL